MLKVWGVLLANQASIMRVLCLHGYSQTASEFASHLRRVTALSPSVEFTFLDGPHEVPSLMKPGKTGRAWWLPRRNSDKQWEFDGVDAALEAVRSAAGPDVQAVLGFSQGAALASLIAALHAEDAAASPVPGLRLVACVGGFPFTAASPDYSHLFRAPLQLPSLHVTGANDEVVSPAKSSSLASLFEQPQRCQHAGGHAAHVGQGCSSLDAYAQFFAAAPSSKL